VELALVYNSSPSLDFHSQKKNVDWHIYDLCPQIFVCSRQKNMYWCTAGLSLQDVYWQQAKEHVLVYSWPLSKMFIYSSQRKTYCFKVVSICRFLFAGKGTRTGVQQVSILKLLS